MKNPRMSEVMLTITNRYALAEEVTLDTREQKKENDSGHADHPSSSKGHDKKRKADRSVNAVERLRHNKEYRPKPGEFEGFLDRICIFHPRESTRPGIATDSKVSQIKYSRWPKGLIKRKKPEEPKGDFLEAHKEVNYIYGGPDSYESRRKQKLTAREVMAVSPVTPSTLSGLRSPSPSTTVTTRTLFRSRGDILSLSAPSSRMLSSTEFLWMEAVP
jgi:hypothetical protein